MSTPTIKISISIEQINDYAKRISDDSFTTIEHDGILIDKVIMDEIQRNKHAFIDDYSDLKKNYNMEIHNPKYVDNSLPIDLTKFASLPPQPYLSWVISDDLTTWEPPVEYPDGTGDGLNIQYIWNEAEKRFDPRLPDEPQPFPSWIPSDPFTNLEFSMVWIPPKPYPDGTGEGYNKSYRWNEETLTWQDILI